MAVTEWRPSRLFVRRSAIALAILTIGAPFLAGVAAWIIAGRTVPPLDGERRLPGLRAPVEVLFDSWGVPHVYARDSDDAWLVAGYLQARERLWKMELYRRAASGRLSELFGERTLPTDRRFLALGLRTAASVEWAQSTPAVRAALERHAAGVNAVIQQLTTVHEAGRISVARGRSDAVDANRFPLDQQTHGVAARRESAWRVGARGAGAPVGLAGSDPADGTVHVMGADGARDRLVGDAAFASGSSRTDTHARTRASAGTEDHRVAALRLFDPSTL